VSALSVHLNREKPREVDAPASFDTHRPFDVALENHGDGCHVYVQLDEALSSVARLPQREQRVAQGATEHVRVAVDALDEPVTGELSISLGYGTATAKTTLTVAPPQRGGSGVAVDESLGTPQQPAEPRRPDVRMLALFGLACLALLAAVAVALTVESTVVLGAAATVAVVTVAGVVFALY